MTLVVVKNITANGDSAAVQIKAGRYMFAAGGNFDGATMTFKVNVGPSKDVPIENMAYAAPKADIVWLPTCTGYVTISAAGASTDISGTLALVALDVI